MKRALVLSGGGASAAFHLGVMEELYKRGHRWDVFCGTSAGAIQAAFLSQFSDVGMEHIEYLQRVWSELAKKKPVRLRIPWFVSSFFSTSLFTSQKLEELIDFYIDPEQIRQSRNKLIINATDLVTGRTVIFREDSPNLRKAVQASASIPGVFPPVELEDWLLVDGATRTNTPGNHAYMLREELDISVCSPPLERWSKYGHRRTMNIMKRSLDIVMDEAFSNDFDKEPTVRIFRPSVPIKGLLNFSERKCAEAVALGRESVRQSFQPA